MEINEYNLPIITYPSVNPGSNRMLFLLSGDGGWMDFEDQLATNFANRGFHVIGFNSRSYFWEQKTPQQAADDMLLLIEQYSAIYKANRIYLSGYSFGADVIPFIYNRLPKAVRSRVVALEMLSPYASSDFMVHTSDLLNIASDNRMYKVQTEVDRITIPIYCFYGKNEPARAFFDYKKKNFLVQELPGDHHYDLSGYDKIVNMFRPLRFLRRSPF
ncbi:MAG: hypothetical protein EOO88_22045 [Pedobacter sp.]|nr:MAG: hypothetical protein EOO88_22045 [Pedobacter sp.]